MTYLTTLFMTASMQHSLPPKLLESLCYVESNHKVTKIHKLDGKTDSYGVCQIKLETAKYVGFKGTKTELMEATTNIYYSAKYLKYQISRYHDVTKGIIAYNRGNAKGLTSTQYSNKVINKWRINKYE